MNKYIKLFGKFIATEFKEFIMGVSLLYLEGVLLLLLVNIATGIMMFLSTGVQNRGINLMISGVFSINWFFIFLNALHRRREYLASKNIKITPMYALCEVCGSKMHKIHVYEAPAMESEYRKYWGIHETLCMCEKCKHKYFDGCQEDWPQLQKKHWLHVQTKKLFEAVDARDKLLRESPIQHHPSKEGNHAS